MSLFINGRKVKAAAHSMHQFCEAVRHVFRHPVDDAAVEACTMHLYLSLVGDVFGRRFAERTAGIMGANLKYCSVADMRSRLEHLRSQAASYAQQADTTISGKLSESSYQQRVRSIIKAMFAEAGHPIYDEEVSEAFTPFENVSRRIRDHLMGIKQQNAMLMR